MTSSRISPVAQPHPGPNSLDRPIEEYGFIGDMRGSALVSSEGSIDWLCAPKFDSVPTFFALLDRAQGGCCDVTLAAGRPAQNSRSYRPETNILETTLAAAAGCITIVDFMAVSVKPDAGLSGADSDAPGWLVRHITCPNGSVSLRLRVAPRFDWGRANSRSAPVAAGGAVYYREHGLFVAASQTLRCEGPDVVIDVTLRQGDTLSLVLGHGSPPTVPIADIVPSLLADTQEYWTRWSARCTYTGLHADLVLRSALCLKLLTYAPTGALIAALTTSLPEAVGAGRNWDYRFVWTRDASFTAAAFVNLGFDREAAEFLRFLHEIDTDGDPLRIMYGVDGDLPEEQNLEHLSGWRGSRPVMTGNLAYTQAQYEIYGELLAALNLFVTTCGTDRLCPSLRDDLPNFIARLAETVVMRWREPDHGIWEIRGPATHQVHSKALCWVALDRAVKLAPLVGIEAPAHWGEARDAIMEDILAHGWNEAKGAYTMSYGSDDLDAAVLRLPLMQVIKADDPRMRATSDAIDRQLSIGDLYYRYRQDDGLKGYEGAFAACTYWAIGNRVLGGRLHEARHLLAKALARANDLGLFAEEFDVETGAFLGNFPQAFTHMAVIQEILRVSKALDVSDS